MFLVNSVIMSIFSTVLLVSIMYFPCKIHGAIFPDIGLSDTTINVEWNTAYQTMKGFGTFAGRSAFIYNNSKREEFMDLLFGDNGLQLTVIRSTLPPSSNYTNLNYELWIENFAKSKYGVSMFMASAWSPPYEWKSIKGQSTGANFNMLLEKYYPDYAKYIADYVEHRKQIGLDLYSVSPQNEPEYPAPDWDGCVWLPSQTANFVRNHLKPTFLNRNISTKIMIGENADWNVANVYLSTTSMMLGKGDFDIYASHGYSLPQLPNLKYVTYNQLPIPWLTIYDKERWITEASSTDNFDSSMKTGIKLAVSLSRFLTVGNINGYIFWLGVVGSQANEGLIAAKNTNEYIITRVYYVYGHFTRHIKPGYIRVKATKSLLSLNNDLKFVAFKDPTTKSFAVIVTNDSSSNARKFVLQFKDTQIQSESIKAIVTNDNQAWASIAFDSVEDSKIILTVPAMSIITITGTVKNFM